MIVPTLARMIIREHLHRPIKGRILCLGRQTIAMTINQYIDLLKQENYKINDDHLAQSNINYDHQTRDGRDTGYISDTVFFKMLGIDNFQVMDVSNYECADIIHDLNKPISDDLVNQFDFIIDGGTFDHLIDIRIAFENVFKMLKVDGRILQWNAASNFTGAAYISFGPDFFYDYYVLNHFTDCKVYIAALDTIGQLESWDLYEFIPEDKYGYFQSDRILVTVVLAEKCSVSTFNKIPVQTQYREPSLLKEYQEGQALIKASKRKSLIVSVKRKETINYKELRKLYRIFIKILFKLIVRNGGKITPIGFKYIGRL